MTSIDIFGRSVRGKSGDRGEIGPPGPPGPAGIGGIEAITRWFPSLALAEFRKLESSCLLLKDPHSDLHIGQGQKYVKWLSHSTSKHHAEAVFPSSHVLHIKEGRNGLLFKNNLYKIQKIGLSPIGIRSYTVIVMTFLILGKDEQFLISDWTRKENLFRGIAVTSKEIRIYGAVDQGKNYISIDYDSSRNNWTTLTCFWSNIKNTGQYIINKQEKSGTFHCRDVDPLFEPMEVYIGGRLLNTEGEFQKLEKELDGYIGSIEIYSITNAPESYFPLSISELLVNDQFID